MLNYSTMYEVVRMKIYLILTTNKWMSKYIRVTRGQPGFLTIIQTLCVETKDEAMFLGE